MCAKKTVAPKASAPAPFVSSPLREDASDAKNSSLKNFFASIAAKSPSLKKDMEIAGMEIAPEDFVQKSFISSLLLTALLEILLIIVLISQSVQALFFAASIILSIPLFFLVIFNTAMFRPKVLIKKRGRDIDQEIVFCGRHLLIELRSGVTLFDAMVGVTREYGEISREFNKIVEKITLGVPATVALHEVADKSPSSYMRRVLLQIANSVTSGSDVADSLEAVLDQVAKEQIIRLKEYGQTLNPLVMFFMLFGVIIPSLGVAFMIIVFSVIGAGFESMGLALMAGVLGFVILLQFFFLTVAENTRPSFDL